MALQALVMGFGGTGAHILTYLKELTVLKYGHNPESVRFLFFDTISDWKPGSTVKILGGSAEETLAEGHEEGTSLDPNNEYFCLKDRDPNLQKHVFDLLGQAGDPDSYPHLKDWLHTPWLDLHVPKKALSITEGAAQQRQIGRFAMFQNAESIIQQIKAESRKLQQHAQNAAINVWIIGSSAGGTGAGCMLDAAFMTRLAMGNTRCNLNGVIVLPEIYGDKDGIILGRAYSVFRELERLQDIGATPADRYVHNGQQISSRVAYDARGRHTALVQSKLFDNLFYAGRECRSDAQRNSFFTSVANAIDPFLDMVSGPPLLEASLNDAGAAASFGAARLYIPMETYKDLFSWEQVMACLEGACAPIYNDTIVSDLAHGSGQERRDNARSTVENLLPLFKEVLDRAGQTEREIGVLADSLDPKRLVREWYGFGGAGLAGMSLTPAEEQDTRLSFVSPYLSYTETDPDRVPLSERTLLTYNENKSNKGDKESPDESRDRFLREMEAISVRYKNAETGPRTFERGRRLILEKLSAFLTTKIDTMIANELAQNSRFSVAPDNLQAGTAMTRLFKELKECLSDKGPLAQVDAVIARCIDTMKGSEESRQQQVNRSLMNLREWKKSGWFGTGNEVTSEQENVREDAAQYIQAYQKFRLFQDMQRLVREVRTRLEHWANLIRHFFEALVMDQRDSNRTYVEKQLKRLKGRLRRLAENPSAMISCDQADPDRPDLGMQGFRKHLNDLAVHKDGQNLAQEVLASASWHCDVDPKGKPRLTLRLTGQENDDQTTDNIAGLYRILHSRFRKQIDRQLDGIDIFDYLRFIQKGALGVDAKEIAGLLSKAAQVLINAASGEECRLIYKDPIDADKRNLGRAVLNHIAGGLGTSSVSDAPHSDPHSLTLMKIKKPNLDDIINVRDCLEDYIKWQTSQDKKDEKHNINVHRAQVFHPFRPELEAWHIERQMVFKAQQSSMKSSDLIAPRIVRLLENPAKMQVFVHCIAVGAVEKIGRQWVWHDLAKDRDVLLTSAENDPEADLVRSAVIFVLREMEGKTTGLIPIPLEEARQSAVRAAQNKSAKLEDLVAHFIENNMTSYFHEHLPAEFHGDMGHIFRFYADPTTRTQLTRRMG